MGINMTFHPGLYVTEKGQQIDIGLVETQKGKFTGCYKEISLEMKLTDTRDTLRASTCIQIDTDEIPEAIGLKTGIDTYMVRYPDWNDKFFPTMLRCEKTHFWGYLLSPSGSCCGMLCPQPVSAFRYDYNKQEGSFFGHRIHTFRLEMYNGGSLPERHPRIALKKGDCLKQDFYFFRQQRP